MIARVILSLIILGILAVIVHRNVKAMGVAETWRFRSTVAVIGAGVVACLAGVCIVGAAHEVGWIAQPPQPLWRDRRPFKRQTSKNNLKQIGMALANYESTNDTFPLGGSFDTSGRAHHSWMTAILPYTDMPALAKRVDWTVPWNDPIQREVFGVQVPGYQYIDASPRFIDGYSTATYAGNKLVMGGNLSYSIREITDGISNTVIAAEVVRKLKPWGHPVNYRDLKLGINQSSNGFGSPFKGGMNVLWIDGSVRFISETIDANALQAIASPAGGEPFPDL